MATVLIVAHAPTPHTQALREALVAGAGDEAIEGVEVVVRSPVEVDADLINAVEGVVMLSTANFGYMAGLVKDLFDRTFLAIGGALEPDGGASGSAAARLPFALCVHGRYDTEGAERSILTITQALGWRQVAPVLSVLGDVTDEHRAAAHELAATLAAHLSS